MRYGADKLFGFEILEFEINFGDFFQYKIVPIEKEIVQADRGHHHCVEETRRESKRVVPFVHMMFKEFNKFRRVFLSKVYESCFRVGAQATRSDRNRSWSAQSRRIQQIEHVIDVTLGIQIFVFVVNVLKYCICD